MKTNKSKSERELGKAVESLIGKMNSRYGTPSDELEEEAGIERKRSDIALRDEAISRIKELLTYRKLSERFLDEERIDVTYEICTKVSSKGMVTKVAVGEAVRVA